VPELYAKFEDELIKAPASEAHKQYVFYSNNIYRQIHLYLAWYENNYYNVDALFYNAPIAYDTIKDYCIKTKDLIDRIGSLELNMIFQKINSAKPLSPEIKPIFKPEAIQIVFNLLKNFFNEGDQNQLKSILQTGNDANKPLIFLDHGNRLADAFKQLYKADIITGCEKRELESWIIRNFKYRDKKVIKQFTEHYINDIISTKNKPPCKRPLLDAEKITREVLINKY
jgi:hypothetical protein